MGPTQRGHPTTKGPDRPERIAVPAVTTLNLPAALPHGLANKARMAPCCYVAGPENQMLVTVVRKLIAGIGESTLPKELLRWSPLALVGPPGCGKTRLAHGIATHWEATRDETTQLVLTAIDFRRRFDLAIRDGEVEIFRDRLRGLGLLVLEDLHKIPSDARVQEELVTTIEVIRQQRGVVLATLTKPTSMVSSFSRGLLSHFAAGLLVEVAPLAPEARGELLRQALEVAGAGLEQQAVEALSVALPADARLVLKAASELRQRFGKRHPINASQARNYLATRPQQGTPPLRGIATIVAKYYALPLRELRSRSRKQSVVLARAVTIYLARQFTPLSYDEIGRFFGGRDHTTILHNFHRIDQRITTDQALRAAIDELRQKIPQHPG